MRKRLYTYKVGSRSGKDLAAALKIPRIKHDGSRFRPRPDDVIINWGSSTLPDRYLEACRVINEPWAVKAASNKLDFFTLMSQDENARVVDWCTSRATAEMWIERGAVVMCRTKLQGNSGDGIVVATTTQELVAAPLYTKYKKKKSEWRVHIALGEVIFIQQKVRREEAPDEEVNWMVRNHGNGFVFAHKDREPPADVVVQAAAAMDTLGLDFGAVDVIYNALDGVAYVLEVNCAPGLEGTTLERYTDVFKRL
jgi:glutathione synthase/RimK-type ligase-like ATP-grasp enzyme